ncbi:hypothetical protein D3C86_825530 [compost metagenome]
MGVTARRERQIGELLLHRGHHLGVAVAQLMNAVAVKIEVTRARCAGQPTPLRALKQIEAGAGEGLMEKVAAILRQSGLYRLALACPPAHASLPQIDVPFAVGPAAAVKSIAHHHHASPCQ